MIDRKGRRTLSDLLVAIAGVLCLVAMVIDPVVHAGAIASAGEFTAGDVSGDPAVQFILLHIDHADGETGPINIQVVN